MRCEFCGAQVKLGSNVCEYCGSEVKGNEAESQTQTKDGARRAKSVLHMICKVIVILACIWAAVIVISLIIVINSDALKNSYHYSADTNSVNILPRNVQEITGKIIRCDEKGIASIEYKWQVYDNVKILDEDLIEWINDTGRSLDTVEICFETDDRGDICKLGLLSADFVIMEKEDTRYIAVRDEDVISFVSETPLKTGCCYSGYFSYPDMRLYSAEEKELRAMSYMDPICEDKESMSVQEYYTGEEIIVYKMLVNGEWYYCSKEIYDAVQIGDILFWYEMYSYQTPAFIGVKDDFENHL